MELGPDLASQPWPEIFQNEEYLSTIADMGGPTGIDFSGIVGVFDIWQQYNDDRKKVYLRETYNEELTKAVNFGPVIESILTTGEDLNVHGNRQFVFSRKAGIAGGIIGLPNDVYDYIDQPGILDIHFEINGGYKYSEQIVWPNDIIGLAYNFLTFGDTWLELWGDSDQNNLFNYQQFVSANHYTGISECDALPTASADHNELNFEIKTNRKQGGNLYVPMLTSDYSVYYEDIPQTLKGTELDPGPYFNMFKGGISTRSISENPLDNPLNFWPYTLPIRNGMAIHNQGMITFVASEPGVTIQIRDKTFQDSQGTYPNAFNDLPAPNYEVYLDTDGSHQLYTIRAPLTCYTNGMFKKFIGFSVENPGDVSFGPINYSVPGYGSQDIVFHTAGATVTANYLPLQDGDIAYIGNMTNPIPAGAVVNMPPRSKLVLYDPTRISGTSDEPITFQKAGTEKWDGIQLETNGELSQVVIKNAKNALLLYGNGRSPTVRHSQFLQCDTVIKVGDHNHFTGTPPNLTFTSNQVTSSPILLHEGFREGVGSFNYSVQIDSCVIKNANVVNFIADYEIQDSPDLYVWDNVFVNSIYSLDYQK